MVCLAFGWKSSNDVEESDVIRGIGVETFFESHGIEVEDGLEVLGSESGVDFGGQVFGVGLGDDFLDSEVAELGGVGALAVCR
jgi:hypothetical protein